MIEFLVVMFPPLQRGWVQYDGCDGSATTVIGMRWKQVPPKTFASVVFLYIFILFYSIPLYKSLVMVGSSLMWKLYDAFLPSLIFLFLFVLFCFGFVLVLFWWTCVVYFCWGKPRCTPSTAARAYQHRVFTNITAEWQLRCQRIRSDRIAFHYDRCRCMLVSKSIGRCQSDRPPSLAER